MARDEDDPKGLMRESYQIDGITLGECRSVFMDWALSLAPDDPAAPRILRLLARYGAAAPDHPMTQVLHEGRAAAPPAKRRGGRAGRISAGPPLQPPET